eukprot:IDg5261t1
MKLLSPRSRRADGKGTVLHGTSDAGVVPTLPTSRDVTELVVIYDADGTVSGELIYMTKKLLGLGHCAACDITHGPRREKPEFTALKTRGWGVPLRNIHRDEMDTPLAAALRAHLPCVGARLADGSVRLLLGHEPLNACGGDVDAFRAAVDAALAEQHLQVAPAPVCGRPPPPSPPVAQTHALHDAVVPASMH